MSGDAFIWLQIMIGKVEYLLGRGEAFWHPEALMTIDLFVHQYLLQAASKRKSLL
jgi:hypothetical protein